MRTVTADRQKRVRIATAKPGQVFAVEPGPEEGSITLTPVRAERKEMFPPGSLLKYFTGKLGEERNKRDLEILSGCVKGPVDAPE